MKDRLIELIQSAVGGCSRYWATIIADRLIKEGILVPPVKIGDKVYAYLDAEEESSIEEYEVKGVLFQDGVWHVVDGEGVVAEVGSDYCLLTREEAERKLKEGKI